MKIKNVKEFRLRADAHAREGHVLQGTYGDARANGKVEYRGCLVGCLSAPHRKRELRAFVTEHSIGRRFSIDDDEQRRIIAREFGLTELLVNLAEGFFEAQPTHGAAIEFVPAFARALVEGASVEPAHCVKWAEENLGVGEGTARRWRTSKSASFVVVEGAIKSAANYEDSGVAEKTDAFLGWLRGMRAAR